MALTSEFEVEEVEAHKEKATIVYLTKLGSVNDSVGCVGLDFLELVPKVRRWSKGTQKPRNCSHRRNLSGRAAQDGRQSAT